MTNIDDIMANAHVVLEVYSGLHVVADHTCATPAGRHRASVRIHQLDLPIGGCAHPRVDLTKLLHLRLEFLDRGSGSSAAVPVPAQCAALSPSSVSKPVPRQHWAHARDLRATGTRLFVAFGDSMRSPQSPSVPV